MSQTSLRFVLLTENISFIPHNILESSQIVSLARPSQEQYLTLASTPATSLLHQIETQNIMNIKEIKTMNLLTSLQQIPTDTFDNVCQPIIDELKDPAHFQFSSFREKLYDIMVYNVDAVECIWAIVSYFVSQRALSPTSLTTWIQELNIFLKQYNNNYRPIYHLERIFLSLFLWMHPGLESQPKKLI